MLWAAIKALFSCDRDPDRDLPARHQPGADACCWRCRCSAWPASRSRRSRWFSMRLPRATTSSPTTSPWCITPMTFLSGVYFPIDQMPPLAAGGGRGAAAQGGGRPGSPTGSRKVAGRSAAAAAHPHGVRGLRLLSGTGADPPPVLQVMARFAEVLLRLALLAGAAAFAGAPALAADDFLEPEKAFQFSARAARSEDGRDHFRHRPRLLPLPRAVQVRGRRRDPRHRRRFRRGKVKWDQTFEKDVETYRNVLQDPPAGGCRRRPSSASSPPARAAPMRACAIRRCRAARASAWPASAAAASSARSPMSPAPCSAAARASRSDGDAGAVASPPAASSARSSRCCAAARSGRSSAPSSSPACCSRSRPACCRCCRSSRRSSSARRSRRHLRGDVRGRGAMAASAGRCRAVAASASPLPIRSAWRSSTPLFGVAAGLAGEGLAAALQNPWVLGAFAAGLVALSLSMFGFYNLQLPPALTCRFAAASQRLPAGRARRRVRDGRGVGADRQPLRRRAARRRLALPQPDPRRLARRHGAVLAGRRA